MTNVPSSTQSQETPKVAPQVEIPSPAQDQNKLADVLVKIDANLDKMAEKLTKEKVEEATNPYWKYSAYVAGIAAFAVIAMSVNPTKVGEILSDVTGIGRAVVDVAKQAPRAVNVTLQAVETAVQAVKQTPRVLDTTLSVVETISGSTAQLIKETPSTLAILEDAKNVGSTTLNLMGKSVGGFRNMAKAVCDIDAPAVSTWEQETALGGDYMWNMGVTGAIYNAGVYACHFAFGWAVPSWETSPSGSKAIKATVAFGYPYLVTALNGGFSISSVARTVTDGMKYIVGRV